MNSGLPEPHHASLWQSDEPIRRELLSAERLEQYAGSIAPQPTLPPDTAGRWLAPRVRDNGRVLLQCYRILAEVIREESATTPAAEWFVDNFHIVDDALREIREDLPRGFYRQLPKLADGPLYGYPRVLGLAWGFVAHTDSRCLPGPVRRGLLHRQGHL
jgi:cyclic beta-1,2-glucan synthetase